MNAAATTTAGSDWLRLSDAQRMVWLDLRMGASPRAYLVAARLRIEGRWDVPAARQALTVLQARHDALRLEVDATEPRQRLSAQPPVTLQLHPPGAGDDASVQAWVDAVLARPLQLGDGALFAVDALPCGAGRSEVLFRAHHLLLDHSGLLLAMRAWAENYRLLVTDVPTELPGGSSFTATLQADAAYADSPQAAADIAHWQRRFDEVPPLLLERPLSDAAPPPAEALHFGLRGEAYARWTAACRRAGVTTQRALVALLALALGTRWDRRDLCIGQALHGRDRHTRDVVGMFAAAMPVRCQWRADASLQDAVRGMAAHFDADYQHQRAPMDAIARALGLAARGMPRLFDASISYMPFDGSGDSTQDAVKVSLHEVVPEPIVPLPFLVTDQAAASRLEFTLAPDPACVDAAAASSIVDGLLRSIEVFCSDPQRPVAELEAVGAEERAALLAHNPAPTPWPQRSLPDAVSQQVRRTPEAIAVEDGEQRLSYAELEAQSTALARRIRGALGGRGQAVVGVALPRSMQTVLSLLAILKAGAVYLPLDVAYPAARLQYLLDDAGAALLIDGPQTAFLQAPRLPDNTDDAHAQVPLPPIDPGQLAYVIYTSGSSGQPKPVGVGHAAAVNLAHARQGHDPLGAGDKVLAAISVGFDVSIGQLLLPLLSGATIVIAPALSQLQAEAFWALLGRHRVSHINSVPSFFETVSEALPAQGWTGLKRLMLGGEVLTGAVAKKLQQRLPGTQLVNMYGPTEACIDATAYPVPAQGELPAALPIGRPLPNYRAYILDRLGRLVPPGVAGELCLAGAGLAHGYLGRPGETARKFVADPYGAPGSRMYRTGDRARWRQDGQIEFLGRDDEQVKIRGFRVETGEIEAVLLQHPQVRQAAVLAHKDARGQAWLAGYVVLAAEAGLADSAGATDILKPWLAQQLPEHMVPQAIVALQALPITTNGKLDRKALPVPDFAAVQAGHVAAADALEAALLQAWQTVLELPRIGMDDDFFALGGHSLLAIRLVHACVAAARAQGVADAAQRLSLRALLAAPTPAGMAAQLRGGAVERSPRLVPLREAGTRRPLFCVHPQSGMVWCFADLVQALPADLPVWGLQARGLAPGEEPHADLQTLARDYAAAIRQVQPHGPYRLLGYSSGGVAAHAIAALLHDEGETVELLALLDSPLPEGDAHAVATDEEVLADAVHLLGLDANGLVPQSVAELIARLGDARLADLGLETEDVLRIVATARAVLQATRRHRPRPLELPLVQLRALQRETPPSDWRAAVPSGRIDTHDLDADHLALVGPALAPTLAALLSPHLA